MPFTEKDKAELKEVQARRASGVPPIPGSAPDRARDPRRQAGGAGSSVELAALGRIHESVKAERTAREADDWYTGNESASFRNTPTGNVKPIAKGSKGPSGTVIVRGSYMDN
jgi:hypothetical protein